MSKKMKGNILLLLTAFIWGSAFVAQKAGMEYIEPFTFNGIRCFIGAIVLIPVILIFAKDDPIAEDASEEETRNSIFTKKIFTRRRIDGILCRCNKRKIIYFNRNPRIFEGFIYEIQRTAQEMNLC